MAERMTQRLFAEPRPAGHGAGDFVRVLEALGRDQPGRDAAAREDGVDRRRPAEAKYGGPLQYLHIGQTQRVTQVSDGGEDPADEVFRRGRRLTGVDVAVVVERGDVGEGTAGVDPDDQTHAWALA